MNKKEKILIISGIIIIVAMIILIAVTSKKSPPTNVVPPEVSIEPAATGTAAATPSQAGAVDKFRTEVPKDIKVPELNDKTLTAEQKKEIAVPTIVVTAAPGVASNFRSFDLRGEGGKFAPAKIIARLGDTIHINFTAVDKDYDIVFPSYDMEQTAKQGQTKIIEFQAVKEGNYTYYCQACGGPDSTAKGNIIIAK